MGGESLGNLPNGGSLGGGSLDQDPLGGPPLDAYVWFYGWPTLDPRMFMPPWYPLVAIWSKPTNKLWYRKFQYPTYMKDIDRDAHIIIFKKVIKANGETMEANIINLFGFILWMVFRNGVKLSIIPICVWCAKNHPLPPSLKGAHHKPSQSL